MHSETFSGAAAELEVGDAVVEPVINRAPVPFAGAAFPVEVGQGPKRRSWMAFGASVAVPKLKLGSFDEAGWVAYVRDGIALVRRFAPATGKCK